MSDYLTIIIIGIYTVVYVVVFIIQKKQRENDKDIISKMKSLVDILDVKKIEDFMVMREKTIEMKYNLMLNNEQKLKEIANDVINIKNQEISELIKIDFGSRHFELIRFILATLMTIPKEDRIKFIDSGLPLTKEIFLEMLQDVEKRNV